MKILIIEDDEAIRETLRDFLELNGHTVLAAVDGEEGVRLAAERPELVLCDVGLPGKDGYEVIQAIHRLPGGGDMPFIFLTARADRTTSSANADNCASECSVDTKQFLPSHT